MALFPPLQNEDFLSSMNAVIPSLPSSSSSLSLSSKRKGKSSLDSMYRTSTKKPSIFDIVPPPLPGTSITNRGDYSRYGRTDAYSRRYRDRLPSLRFDDFLEEDDDDPFPSNFKSRIPPRHVIASNLLSNRRTQHASDPSNELRANRLEFIADLFITICTTAIPSTSLISKSSTKSLDGIIYKFKDSNEPLARDLTKESIFTWLLQPKPAKTVSPCWKNSRNWRIAVTALYLMKNGPTKSLFNSASDSFVLLYNLSKNLGTLNSVGLPIGACMSKMALFDLLCTYTTIGTKSWPKSKVNYLSAGRTEYDYRLIIYMIQVCVYFLIPDSRPDPLLVLKSPPGMTKNNNDNNIHPELKGIIELAPSNSFSIASTPLIDGNKELEYIRRVLADVDDGELSVDFTHFRGKVFLLPSPLPVREELLEQTKLEKEATAASEGGEAGEEGAYYTGGGERQKFVKDDINTTTFERKKKAMKSKMKTPMLDSREMDKLMANMVI